MLKRANLYDLESIKAICKGVVGTKILCYITAYGFDRDFLEIWLCTEDEKLTAVIVKFFDNITLTAENNADIEQLSVFLSMSGYNSICCTHELCKSLQLENYKLKKAYRFEGKVESYNADNLTENDMSPAYKLISKEIPDSFSDTREAYLSFLSDYTFRERRGLARGVCTHIEDKISSVALTSSETEFSAIISGVACDSSLRKKGLGKQTVLSLVRLLKKENKEAYVIALNENAEGFYEHIGFKENDTIAFIERINDV